MPTTRTQRRPARLPDDEHDPSALPRLLTLAEAGASLPRPKSAQALWRWSRHGIRGVRLRTCCYGRQHFTTEADLREFGERLAEVNVLSARR